MQGFPEGVMVLNEDAYNIEGKVAWCCDFPSRVIAEDVLRRSFPEGERRGFKPMSGEPGEHRARVVWEFRDQTFFGDVLVSRSLKPLGFLVEVHHGEMAFNLAGEHIPYPRWRGDPPEESE